MSFSGGSAVGGAAQGAQTGAQMGGPWGAVAGAIAGFALGGYFGGRANDVWKDVAEQGGKMVAGSGAATESLTPYTSGAGGYYAKTMAQANNIMTDPTAQTMISDSMRQYTQQQRAAGKSLSGRFVSGAADAYMKAFSDAQTAILGPGIQAEKQQAQGVAAQMQGYSSTAGASMALESGQVIGGNAGAINMAANLIGNSFSKSEQFQPDYAAANYKSQQYFSPYESMGWNT